MYRSQINYLMKDAIGLFESYHIHLPPFAYWTPEDWKKKGTEAEEIVDNRLGWDITDYGLNDFAQFGLLLFTFRNCGQKSWDRGFHKHYAEKIMIAEFGQKHQMHFHQRKMEDIINRGGGKLAIELHNSTEEGELSSSDLRINIDGLWNTLPAGSTVLLAPGESITLTPGLYHRFWAEGERVLIGEVSSVNDDHSDNHFYKMIGTGRFSSIEEDESPLYLLSNEYEKYWNKK
jgi:D-lyxose ketol-isomerase